MIFSKSEAIPLRTLEIDISMPREVMRKSAVLAATGWSKSTLYAKIKQGKFPKPVRLDPEGRCAVWFSDEVSTFQNRALAAASHKDSA